MHAHLIDIPKHINRISAAEYRDLLAGKPLSCCGTTEAPPPRSPAPTPGPAVAPPTGFVAPTPGRAGEGPSRVPAPTPGRAVVRPSRSPAPTPGADCPLEHDEQAAFVQWLRLKDIRHNATPNGGHRAAKTAKWLKAEGVSPGFPDITVWPEAGSGLPVLYVEMKRRAGGRPSAEQAEWVAYLDSLPGHKACVCKGALQAIAFVTESWALS